MTHEQIMEEVRILRDKEANDQLIEEKTDELFTKIIQKLDDIYSYIKEIKEALK